jgi:hypothetical protein
MRIFVTHLDCCQLLILFIKIFVAIQCKIPEIGERPLLFMVGAFVIVVSM